MNHDQTVTLKGTKRLFLKLGSCSRTLGFILDREFGQLKENEEKALDPLAGGILQQGYQCGMLWGASMAVSAEAGRRNENENKSIALSIHATKHILDSFVNRAKFIDCDEISECNWSSKASVAKYFVSGKVVYCYKLLEKWAPEAVEAAYEGLSTEESELPVRCRSCAFEVARKMGATNEEAIMVAGFAGGIGLSGDACGALGAAIWMKTLNMCKENPGKTFMNHPKTRAIMARFNKETEYEIECKSIVGRTFSGPEDHTSFLDQGGCEKLIAVLGES